MIHLIYHKPYYFYYNNDNIFLRLLAYFSFTQVGRNAYNEKDCYLVIKYLICSSSRNYDDQISRNMFSVCVSRDRISISAWNARKNCLLKTCLRDSRRYIYLAPATAIPRWTSKNGPRAQLPLVAGHTIATTFQLFNPACNSDICIMCTVQVCF